MKKRFLIISLLVFSFITYACSSSNDNDNEVKLSALSGDQIRIASYNLLFQKSLPTAVNERWSSRIVQVEHIFRDCNLDIIGTQEALTFQVNMLLRMDEFGRLGGDLPTGGSDNPMYENEAIFYRKSRFDVLDSGNFWYSLTPSTPGSYSWDATYARMCTWGKFKEKTSGKIFYVFNSQFHVEATKARVEEAKMLLAKVKEVAGEFPVFCTGDLNALPESEAITTLLSGNTLYDSKAIAKTSSGPDGTYSGFSTTAPVYRIDYVLASSGINIDFYRVIDEELTTLRFGSDHLPVVVDATIQ